VPVLIIYQTDQEKKSQTNISVHHGCSATSGETIVGSEHGARWSAPRHFAHAILIRLKQDRFTRRQHGRMLDL
jgi:hypothetical protein